MTTFAYTAMDASGRRKSGFVDAASQEAAVSALSQWGRYVLEIAQDSRASLAARSHAGARKGNVGRGDVALFTRRMADLAAAGLPPDRVLQVVAEQSESQQLTLIAEEALGEVRAGKPVSDALAMHPKVFPDVYTQTLRAGEASGQFPEVAGRLAEFLEREVARRSQIVSALVYPAVLTVV